MYGATLSDTVSTVAPTWTLRYQWTGREYDGETGWYYFRARYYDPNVRRFVQEDPIGYGGGGNLYAYAAGGPLQARDPSGMHLSATIDACVGGDWNCPIHPASEGGTLGYEEAWWTNIDAQRLYDDAVWSELDMEAAANMVKEAQQELAVLADTGGVRGSLPIGNDQALGFNIKSDKCDCIYGSTTTYDPLTAAQAEQLIRNDMTLDAIAGGLVALGLDAIGVSPRVGIAVGTGLALLAAQGALPRAGDQYTETLRVTQDPEIFGAANFSVTMVTRRADGTVRTYSDSWREIP
jgi:RHS repeat-associated protein